MKDLSSLTKEELIALLNKKDEEIKDVLNELSSANNELSSVKDELLSSSNELSFVKGELVQTKEELEVLRVSNRELNEMILLKNMKKRQNLIESLSLIPILQKVRSLRI